VMLASRMPETLGRSHGAVGADDRPAGTPDLVWRRARCCGLMRLAGQGGRYIPGGSDSANRSRNPSSTTHQRSVRFARNAAILEEDPTWHRIADSGLGRYRLQGDAYFSRVELSVGNPASRS